MRLKECSKYITEVINMRNLRKVTATVLVLLLLLSTQVFAGENLKYIEQKNESKFFSQVASDLVEIYQFDITKQELLERTFTNLLNEDPQALDTFLRALFSSLDEYSEFYSAEEYAQLTRQLENVGGGVGVYITKGSRYAEIVSVIDGSPAQKAGLCAGDLIVAVDGENMLAKNYDYVSAKMRGEIGSEVSLKVLRDGNEIDFVLVRAELKQSTVSYAIVGENVGYLQIISFSSETDKEVASALAEFNKYGIKKIILDLRYNTGGYVEVAVDVAKRFVPAGIIATHKVKATGQSTQYRSTLKNKPYQLVTLVNEYTASAAELLASALQESGASKLIGKQTYGKAVTQNILGVYGGRMCKVTTGEYLTRKGKSINKVGIKPDYTISNKTLLFEYTDADKMKFLPEYALGYEGEGLSAIKQRLTVLGYNAGATDTSYDETMANAVMAFQSDNGLEATGIMDIYTQMRLSDKADKVEMLIDMQLSKAFELMGIEYTGYLAANK